MLRTHEGRLQAALDHLKSGCCEMGEGEESGKERRSRITEDMKRERGGEGRVGVRECCRVIASSCVAAQRSSSFAMP